MTVSTATALREVWISPARAAAMFGVKAHAIRRLDGRLTVQRTPGGHRRYLEDECRTLAAQLRMDGTGELAMAS